MHPRVLAVLVGAVGSALTTGQPTQSLHVQAAQAQTTAPKPHVAPSPYAAVESVHSPFARVAEIVSPSVVFVEVRAGEQRGRRGPFGDFYRDFEPRGRRPSSGSGFVMDRRGYILTNNHVIEGADEFSVTFLDGESYPSEVVGQDPHPDIASLRITAPARGGQGFPALILGDSDEIRVGDWAIAVGNPFGEQLAGTVTVGVISAKGRSDLAIMGASTEIDLQDFIQTDASINFGNSGGPLVNIRGEVVGVNSALNAQGQGIGFAIPVNLAAAVAHQLIETGRVRRGYLGIEPVALTRALAEGNDWDIVAGILVQKVVEDSPADRAGLRPDDGIVEFDGRPVSNAAQFRLLVAGTEVGKSVALKVHRAGSYLDLTVTLRELEAPGADVPASQARQGSWLGLHVEDTGSDEIRERFGLDAGESGVVITEVEPGSPAEEQGLEPGEIILEIVNREVEGIEQYDEIRAELQERRKPITMKVKEGGTVRYVVLRPRS